MLFTNKIRFVNIDSKKYCFHFYVVHDCSNSDSSSENCDNSNFNSLNCS